MILQGKRLIWAYLPMTPIFWVWPFNNILGKNAHITNVENLFMAVGAPKSIY